MDRYINRPGVGGGAARRLRYGALSSSSSAKKVPTQAKVRPSRQDRAIPSSAGLSAGSGNNSSGTGSGVEFLVGEDPIKDVRKKTVYHDAQAEGATVTRINPGTSPDTDSQKRALCPNRSRERFIDRLQTEVQRSRAAVLAERDRLRWERIRRIDTEGAADENTPLLDDSIMTEASDVSMENPFQVRLGA